MEKLKQGYKQTDIGVIPEYWEVKSVNEIFKFLSTATFSRAELSDEGEIQCLHYGDIHTKFNEFVDFNSVTLSKVTGKRSLNYALLQDGDIIMADASEDHVGLCKSVEIKNITNKRAISGLHTILLREKNSIYENGFRGYLFLVPEVKKQLNSLATGMKVFGVSKKNLTQVLLPVPTQSEQTAIATALSNVDILISALDKKITKKQQIKQGAMQQLLTGKKRLTGFSGEWVETRLGSGLKFQTGNPFSSLFFNKDNFGVRLIKNRDLKSDDQVVFYSGQYTDDFIVNNGDVLIGMDGDFLPCIWRKGMALLNQRVGRIMITSDWNAVFLYYYLYNPLKEKQEGTGATTVKHLSHKDIENMELPLPPTVVEQTAIAQILTDMDNEISQLEADRNKYEQIKAGMMQQLLTGKIRLTGSVQTTIIPEQTKTVELNSKKQTHTDQINEAVVISFLVNKFSSVQYPLSRFRYTKYTYLLHRQYEHVACGFKKHAAGPYKPENRYKGPENIAIKNKYISKVENSKSGKDAFITNVNIAQALNYFNEWYSSEIQEWIEQFRFYKNDDLEVLTTVDESICDLNCKGTDISVTTIKNYIASIPQWKHKLTKSCFSDLNIERMIRKSNELFSQ
ncbi:MAG: restriction endonuclease subunit S [Bacteroidetes bacterium]|nr:restriction endonuclease subunit S [Bacteroidota bacterium]MCL6101736.1 restriction endonuclease subunit S [Bacteroidota bacterium]